MPSYGLQGAITLFYYRDIEAASTFYESIGFTLEVDLYWWKAFKIEDGIYLGLVGGDFIPEGINSKKAVKLIVMVDDVESWFKKLKELRLKLDHDEVYSSSRLNLREFSLSDPEGYSIEFCQFLSPLGV